MANNSKHPNYHQENVESDLLDIESASILLGYKTSSLYQMTSKRAIPFFKIPGHKRLFFSKKELERWVLNEANRVKTHHELVTLAMNRCQN
jgi:hypothetical protein